MHNNRLSSMTQIRSSYVIWIISNNYQILPITQVIYISKYILIFYHTLIIIIINILKLHL